MLFTIPVLILAFIVVPQAPFSLPVFVIIVAANVFADRLK